MIRGVRGFVPFSWGIRREQADPVTSYRIPIGPEGLIGKLWLGCAGIAEGLRSGRYVGLGRDGLLDMPGPGKWPLTENCGFGKWPIFQDRPGILRSSSGSEAS